MSQKPQPEGPELEVLLDEQLAFYRADAAAYERWHRDVFEAGGGGEKERAGRRDQERLLATLRAAGLRGPCLELACGTGTWTGHLARLAPPVTAVDASPESLAIARVKHASVSFVEADLFGWRPAQRYGSVFFGYWLSHVPPARFEAFITTVAEALAPGGVAFLVDSTGAPLARGEDPSGYREHDDLARRISVRELDGRSYRVVKVTWPPGELEERLLALGFEARFERGETAFWGTLRRLG